MNAPRHKIIQKLRHDFEQSSQLQALPVKYAAKELGVSPTTVHNWRSAMGMMNAKEIHAQRIKSLRDDPDYGFNTTIALVSAAELSRRHVLSDVTVLRLMRADDIELFFVGVLMDTPRDKKAFEICRIAKHWPRPKGMAERLEEIRA